jgi:hypothetical protein
MGEGAPNMDEEVMNLLSKPTASVQDFGRVIFKLSKNASYCAAHAGQFGELIRTGRLLHVPTAPWRRKLGLDPTEAARCT